MLVVKNKDGIEVLNNQIYRSDGKDCFVEVLNTAFGIGKVLLKFVNYDSSRNKGSKFVDEIDIYMDIPSFMRFKYDILESKKIINEIMKSKKDAEEKTKLTGSKVWANQMVIDMGGTKAEDLEKRDKSRPDKMSESRVLKIFAGDKYPVILRAESGAGERDEKGLIVPKYGINPEHKVQISFTPEKLKELLLTTEAHINSYFNFVYNNYYGKEVKNG